MKEPHIATDNGIMMGPAPRASGSISLFALLLALGAAAIWWLSQRADHSKMRSVERLRRAIIGNDKSAIAAVFGPPRASAGFGSVAPAMLVGTDSFHADIWYFSLDQAARQALVVQFDHGIAKEAQLLRPPVK